MGILRKVISGSAAFATGGASLAAVQFRSDTERNTREIKKLRKAIAASGSPEGVAIGAPGSVDPFSDSAPLNLTTYAATDALTLSSGSVDQPPDDLTPGWKAIQNQGERFWNGHQWTKLAR